MKNLNLVLSVLLLSATTFASNECVNLNGRYLMNRDCMESTYSGGAKHMIIPTRNTTDSIQVGEVLIVNQNSCDNIALQHEGDSSNSFETNHSNAVVQMNSQAALIKYTQSDLPYSYFGAKMQIEKVANGIIISTAIKKFNVPFDVFGSTISNKCFLEKLDQ